MQIGPEEVKATTGAISDADVYWRILARLLPIVFVGGLVAMIVNLTTILHERTWARRLCTCLTCIAVGCVAAGVAALGLSLFIARPSPELELVSAAVAGSGGQKIFDIYGQRLFGRYYRTADVPPSGQSCADQRNRPDGHDRNS